MGEVELGKTTAADDDQLILAADGGGASALVSSSEPIIRDLIYTVRSKQVMLDSDLARLYQVETGALNRAAKRNENRFPEDFRFRITRGELDNLRCQIGIFAGQVGSPDVGRTYLPYVYTEQGVAMLAGVLHSKVAVEASVRIMRTFVEMRHFIASNAAMFEQIRAVELRQLEYQRSTDAWSVKKSPLWGDFSDMARAA